MTCSTVAGVRATTGSVCVKKPCSCEIQKAPAQSTTIGCLRRGFWDTCVHGPKIDLDWLTTWWTQEGPTSWTRCVCASVRLRNSNNTKAAFNRCLSKVWHQKWSKGSQHQRRACGDKKSEHTRGPNTYTTVSQWLTYIYISKFRVYSNKLFRTSSDFYCVFHDSFFIVAFNSVSKYFELPS